MKRVFITLAVFIALSACTDAELEKHTNYGNSFKVEMYSGGELVRSWISSGKVLSEEGSDGYYFKDSKTGKLVEVTGDIVITNYDSNEETQVIPSNYEEVLNKKLDSLYKK